MGFPKKNTFRNPLFLLFPELRKYTFPWPAIHPWTTKVNTETKQRETKERQKRKGTGEEEEDSGSRRRWDDGDEDGHDEDDDGSKASSAHQGGSFRASREALL